MHGQRWKNVLAVTMALWAGVAMAADPAADLRAEYEAAVQAAAGVMQRGPADVPVAGQATLKIPQGYGFIPANEAKRLLHAMGNQPGDEQQGMIYPLADQDANWFVVVSYEAAGYIKDDDARDWNADDLLSSIREGTEDANKKRAGRGLPEMEIIGWAEKPQYDAAARRLVWSVASRDKGEPANAIAGINYNTLALGREGYISMNLVTDTAAVESLKPTAKEFLAGLNFNEGRRYSDFNVSTDKVAEYGLAALVAGVAVKKLGLFALIAAFAVKFAKVIALGALAGAGVLGKFWKRKKSEPQDAA